jgi:hypothetical protein
MLPSFLPLTSNLAHCNTVCMLALHRSTLQCCSDPPFNAAQILTDPHRSSQMLRSTLQCCTDPPFRAAQILTDPHRSSQMPRSTLRCCSDPHSFSNHAHRNVITAQVLQGRPLTASQLLSSPSSLVPPPFSHTQQQKESLSEPAAVGTPMGPHSGPTRGIELESAGSLAQGIFIFTDYYSMKGYLYTVMCGICMVYVRCLYVANVFSKWACGTGLNWNILLYKNNCTVVKNGPYKSVFCKHVMYK